MLGLDGNQGLNIDIACSQLGYLQDTDRQNNRVDEILDALVMLSRTMGNDKAKFKARDNIVDSFDTEEPTVEEIMNQFTSQGLVRKE